MSGFFGYNNKQISFPNTKLSYYSCLTDYNILKSFSINVYTLYMYMHALKRCSITELKSHFSSINTHILQCTCVHLRISKSCVDQVSNTMYSFNLQVRYIHAQVCKNNIPIFKILLSFAHEYICMKVPCTFLMPT